MPESTTADIPSDARQRLERERERLIHLKDETLGNESTSPEQSDLGELSSLDQHPADVGTEVLEREKDRSIVETIEGELADIEAAFARLEDGSYGTCESCGAPIGKDRLEAVPYARLCVDDQARLERP